MINKIKKKLKGKNAKSLIENFTSLSVLQLVEYIFPLLTLPYLARVIGVEKFGALAFATAVIAYFIAIVDYGFNYTAVRDISKQKEDSYAVSIIYSNILFARLVLMLISFFLLVILILTVPIFRDNKLILLFTFLQIPAKTMLPDWFFQGMEKMKFITIRSTLAKLIFTVLVFVVIRKEEDYIYHPLLLFFGLFISGLSAQYYIFKSFNIKLIVPKYRELYNTVRDGWDMFLSIFFPNIYSNFSGILLQAYGGNYANGIFDAGRKFIAISQKITNVISRTFYPFLARRMDKHIFFQKISFTISLIISVVLFVGADFFIHIFYTKAFDDAVFVLRILSVSIVFMFLVTTYGTNYLVLINKERILKIVTVICSLFGLLLSWIAVIYLSFIGAALTLLIVRATMGTTIWIMAKKYQKELLNN